jgi:hypothetical protein
LGATSRWTTQDERFRDPLPDDPATAAETPPERGFWKRLMGFEPTTFCMASSAAETTRDDAGPQTRIPDTKPAGPQSTPRIPERLVLGTFGPLLGHTGGVAVHAITAVHHA